jgi:hypothetical protein
VSEQIAPTKPPQGYEPCEECGAPLDPQQRYCVECAARRGNGSNPSSRYFAAMSKKSRRPQVKGQSKAPGGGSRAAAVGFFALLPIAVALGVVVGRSGSGNSNEQALLNALHQAEKQQVAAAPVATEEEASAPTEEATKKGVSKGKSGGKASTKGKAKKTKTGSGQSGTTSKQGAVEKVEGFEPSEADVKEDTELVAKNPEQTGKSYIEAQQNLPEVTVVGGSGSTGSSGSELPPGVEP